MSDMNVIDDEQVCNYTFYGQKIYNVHIQYVHDPVSCHVQPMTLFVHTCAPVPMAIEKPFLHIPGLFDKDKLPWLMDMLKSDVFEGAERISRDHFMAIRGNSSDKNEFWKVVSQIAVEKFNIQEVFNMRSTVRLTAIEKLC